MAALFLNRYFVILTLTFISQVAFGGEEVDHLQAEQQKLVKDTKKIEAETVAVESEMKTMREQIEKLKKELQQQQQLKSERAGAFLTKTSQRDQMRAELESLQNLKASIDKEIQAAIEQEELAREKWEQAKLEHLQRKAQLNAQIANLKNQKNAIIARTPSANPTFTEDDEDDIGADPMIQKIKCEVYDGPEKDSNVLATQEPGASVLKTDEGSTWIAFWVDDNRKGYIAKNCF